MTSSLSRCVAWRTTPTGSRCGSGFKGHWISSTSDFSWEAVTRRWDAFIADLEDAAEIPRVAMVTTWNSRCGVAENTRHIVENSHGAVAFEIFSNKGADIIDPARELGVARTWVDRWNPDLGELEDSLRLADPDVVHIQFNFGFFELERMAELIERQLEHRAVVVTLHRTNDIEIEGGLVSLRSIRPTLGRVDRLIVHQEADARILADMGLTDNVSVMPVGSAPPPDISPAEVRKALGLGTRPVIGTFGFLLPHKGTLELLGVVDALRAEFPDICLLALCARYPLPLSDEYEQRVRAEIEARGLADNVVLISDYLPDDVGRMILRGVDAIVLPYQHTEESSSAALRFLLPLERPVIVTDQEIFADCRDAVLAVDPTDPIWIEDALRRVADRPRAPARARAACGHGRSTVPVVAGHHRSPGDLRHRPRRAPAPEPASEAGDGRHQRLRLGNGPEGAGRGVVLSRSGVSAPVRRASTPFRRSTTVATVGLGAVVVSNGRPSRLTDPGPKCGIGGDQLHPASCLVQIRIGPHRSSLVDGGDALVVHMVGTRDLA